MGRAFARLLVGAAVFVGGQLFVGPFARLPRNARLARLEGHAEALDLEARRAKCPLTQQQLEGDHGDKWEDVRDILVGLRAASPEAIMRARFTALKFQDPQFLAATEKDDAESIRERAKQWSMLLGLEETNAVDNLLNLNNPATSLREPVGIDIVASDGEWVEFKIRCASKTLSEKSRFIKDRKYGWVYGGETEYSQWMGPEHESQKAIGRIGALKEVELSELLSSSDRGKWGVRGKSPQADGRTATKRGTTPGTAATWGTATSPRMDLEAEVTKLCEEQKKLAAKSWQKPLAELTKKLSDEERKQQVLLGQQGQAMLRSFVRPPALHTMGFIRAGMAPKEIYQRLAGHYHHHRQRMFSEFFTPVLGNHRNAHVLPMLPEWIMEGGFIDSLLRPMVEKFAGKKLALVNVHPGIRIYKEGATLMRHVDSPERPITVALAIGAAGAGGSWHLELSDPHGNQWRPLPLTMGHMLIYEGVRIAHGRAGPLASGELAMAFAYYRPKENYDAPRLQRHVEQMVSSAPRPTSASQGQAPEFRSVDEL
ncbi:unnamed protein product [Effrenium voratum]|uniref:YchJ-like middle NTF2-like domain-containing protein n=1 Tax=Effrenium voratum TaxID=2562239 RepID=A0AA36NI98_9DINO|nr:unnamed protein product [Effrenium voratum]